MKIPTRPAPSVPQGTSNQRNFFQSSSGKPVGQVKPKKKAPPRPPPPKFNNSVLYDKTWDFPPPPSSSSNNSNNYSTHITAARKPDFTTSLIDLSTPLDDFFQQPTLNPTPNNYTHSDDDFFKAKPMPAPKPTFPFPTTNNHHFPPPKQIINKNFTVGNSSFFGGGGNTTSTTTPSTVNYLDLSTGLNSMTITDIQKPSASAAPTIIRAQAKPKREYGGGGGGVFQVTNVSRNHLDANNYSPPMPTIPPPSPPKFLNNHQQAASSAATFDVSLPHGVALYNYFANHPDDLTIQVNDIVVLIRKVNEEWFYGKVGENEGMFPSNFIEIRVPLPDHNDKIVTCLYEFNPQALEDLKLVPGQKINVIKKISEDWLYGESNGFYGQFPANFVDRIPYNL